MKRFHFSLQAILTLRLRGEQNALEKYARALLTREQAVRQLSAVHSEQVQWWGRWRNQVNQGCSAGALQQWRACDSHLTERRQSAEAALGQAEVAVNQALKVVLLARRDREAVEKHFQKQRLGFSRELNRQEQRSLDEIGQRRGVTALSTPRTLYGP